MKIYILSKLARVKISNIFLDLNNNFFYNLYLKLADIFLNFGISEFAAKINQLFAPLIKYQRFIG